MSSFLDSLGGTLSDFGNTLFGTGSSPGVFGSGQYKVNQYNIDQSAFTNPISTDQQTGGFTGGQGQLQTAANQAAPTLAPAATSSGAGGAGAGQLDVANTLYGVGTGAIPGAAAKTAALEGERQQAANLSAMGGAAGTTNPALARYELGVQNAGVANTTAQNAVTGAAQEQLNALGAAGSQFGQAAQTTQQNQQFNAGQINQQAYNQAQLIGQQRGLQGQELQNFINNYAAQIANTMTAKQSGQQLAVQNNLGTQNIQSGAYQSAAGHNIGGLLTSTAGSALGAIAPAVAAGSDRKLKKNIKPGKNTLDKFLSSIALRK